MKFLSIYKTAENGVPPTAEFIARMNALIEEMTRAGTLIATEGCLPSVAGARVRRSGDRLTVTDGPFAEAKEVIAGFALLEAESKEHAIQLAKHFLDVAGEGECEVRQIFAGEGGCAPELETAAAQQRN